MRSPSDSALPTDVTLDALPASAVREVSCKNVALIEGSGPQITSETERLLRDRLRAAAKMLLFGFGLFLIWRLFGDRKIAGRSNLLFGIHVAIVAIEAFSWRWLRRGNTIDLNHRTLRLFEVLIFGPPVVMFAIFLYQHLLYWADKGFVPAVTSIWFLLMFTYALFIPNTWKRAAVVLASMAVTPVAIVVYLWTTNELFARALDENPDYLVEMCLSMSVGLVTSVYGTHMINGLRREAFEARKLGQYRLLRLLGAGGMGEVYLAEHQMMKRPCAIKVIRPGKANDPQALARFEREVHATAKLSHWNSIEIFDYGRTEDGTFYYVMEYLPGLSLAELVERHGPLPPGRVVHLLTQTCEALAEAHGAGLIHRDIKPGNLFVAQRGGVYDVSKLLDFGLAKPMMKTGTAQLTHDGMISGSPLFMSPEQAMGDRDPDARSDIYALGAVGYYMLTGTPPFPGDNPVKVILALTQETVPPPTRLRADIPADLERVIMRCLAKDPDRRYSSALDLADALRKCSCSSEWNRDFAAQWWKEHGEDDEATQSLAEAAI